MNLSDSERIASVLEALGWQRAEGSKDADLVVVNACAVRQSAMNRIYGRVQLWNKIKRKRILKTLLMGCVLEADRKKLSGVFDWILPIKDLAKLPELLGYDKLPIAEYFEVLPHYTTKFSAYVPIMTGCDKFCTYCAVPYTRGREASRPMDDILAEVKKLVASGYREIMLLGQNVNSYRGCFKDNPDKVVDFPDLLQMVCDIPGNFWVQFLTSHPYDMSDKLIEAMARNDKIGKYVNFPVQSGSDEVLKKMNRHYTIAHYKERINKLRELMPDIVISTDIIVGFYGETEDDLQKTVELFKEVKYDMAYINEYSQREGTAAVKMFTDDLPRSIKKKRKEELTAVLAEISLEKNKKLVGEAVDVLVDKAIKKEGAFLNCGHTHSLKTIQFVDSKDYTGEFVKLKVVSATPWSLEGVILHKVE